MTATASVHDLDRQRRLREAAQDAGRPKMMGPSGRPELERIGMGWEWRPHDKLTLRVTRVKERSDEFSAELTVICPTSGRTDGIIEWGRTNLLSAQTRNGLAKRIRNYVESPWDEWLDLFFREVVTRERQGEQLQLTDPDAKPQPLRYMYRPILPLGMPTLLYGAGGTCKSTLTAGIALSVQTGRSVFSGWHVDNSAPVLILDWEGDRWIWQDRINAIASGMDNMRAPAIQYRPCRRRIVDDAEAIADFIIDHSIGLVVVDAVNQAFGVSGHAEQDPADLAIKAFITIREIIGATSADSQTPTEVTWLLIDHTSGEDLKDGSDTPMKAYGSVSKQWLARSQFYVASEREATETRQEIVIKQTKANYSWKMQPAALVIEREGGTIRFNVKDEITAPELEAQLTLWQRVENALSDGALGLHQLREMLNLNARRADQMKVNSEIRRMAKRGKITQLPDGRYGLVAPVMQAEFGDPGPDPDGEPI